MANGTQDKKSEAQFNVKSASKVADAQVGKVIKKAIPRGVLPKAAQKSAFIDYYLLIDFGFTADQPFIPNSVQFYSNTEGFLCYKRVDDSSLTSLRARAAVLESEFDLTRAHLGVVRQAQCHGSWLGTSRS
jgi:hypothetical protein